MDKKTKYLIAGGVVLAGVGWWWWSNQQHQTAAAQIVSQPTADAVATPSLVVAPSTALTAAAATVTAPNATSLTTQQQAELAALMNWTTKTQNPALYQQMMGQLTGAQVDSLYNILTTEWTTGAAPTAAQTAFWNSLRQQFPFLNTGGVGCNNLQCT
jgi:lipopolysaccharide export system protein LptC